MLLGWIMEEMLASSSSLQYGKRRAAAQGCYENSTDGDHFIGCSAACRKQDKRSEKKRWAVGMESHFFKAPTRTRQRHPCSGGWKMVGFCSFLFAFFSGPPSPFSTR
ncbi:hypothetical protein Peur_044635 [Populus x canadensis]